MPPPQLETFQSLCSRMGSWTISLDNESNAIGSSPRNVKRFDGWVRTHSCSTQSTEEVDDEAFVVVDAVKFCAGSPAGQKKMSTNPSVKAFHIPR